MPYVLMSLEEQTVSSASVMSTLLICAKIYLMVDSPVVVSISGLSVKTVKTYPKPHGCV